MQKKSKQGRILLDFVEYYFCKYSNGEIHMKRNYKFKKLFKRLFFALLIVYVASIFLNQQKTLNSYRNNNDYYVKQIAEETEYQQTLMAMKDNINSPEYIEQIAREKLDMYLPNERIYKVYN